MRSVESLLPEIIPYLVTEAISEWFALGRATIEGFVKGDAETFSEAAEESGFARHIEEEYKNLKGVLVINAAGRLELRTLPVRLDAEAFWEERPDLI
jgi:hypothetical protein